MTLYHLYNDMEFLPRSSRLESINAFVIIVKLQEKT